MYRWVGATVRHAYSGTDPKRDQKEKRRDYVDAYCFRLSENYLR